MLNGLENPHGVRLPKKLCKCSKRWLKEDSPLGGVLFFKSKFLVSCTWTCHDPVGHTSNSTVTTSTGDSTEHTEDKGLGVNICCSSASELCQTGNNDGNSWNSTFEPLSERNLARRTGQPRTLWLRGTAGKQRETRRKGRWNIRVRFPVWWWWQSIFGTRSWFSSRKRFPPPKMYSLQQQNCVQWSFLYLPSYETMRLRPSSFVSYALVDILIRFFDTNLSVLTRSSVIEV